jgi:protein-L-isoaspartate(D-aspartate) O-methyltransferase
MAKAGFSELRSRMVDGQVRTTDVTNASLIEAMLSVPREAFVADAKKGLAYTDRGIEMAPGRHLMAPSPFAKLVQLADIGAGDAVLDVGCGTGYASAVLSRLAGSVVALEADAGLAATARTTLAALGCKNATVVEGPLQAGHAADSPYDVIFVGGAVEAVPDGLFGQLREGGRLVAVEGQGNAGVARLHLKANGVVTSRRAFNAAVMPLPGFERARAFEF